MTAKGKWQRMSSSWLSGHGNLFLGQIENNGWTTSWLHMWATNWRTTIRLLQKKLNQPCEKPIPLCSNSTSAGSLTLNSVITQHGFQPRRPQRPSLRAQADPRQQSGKAALWMWTWHRAADAGVAASTFGMLLDRTSGNICSNVTAHMQKQAAVHGNLTQIRLKMSFLDYNLQVSIDGS